MSSDFLNRSVNEGFSGGEKKRNEILQMLTLEPRLAVLDETDSGLDIDALRTACNEETVGLMLTLPNTLGLFDNNILEICKLVHDCG